MREVDDYSDERNKTWCIHCGATIAVARLSRDHVPTKALLSSELREKGARFDGGKSKKDDYLPQVLVCEACNASFSRDEEYLLCVLHALFAGSLYPDQNLHPDAANILRSNRDVVRSLKYLPNSKKTAFEKSGPFVLSPDPDRILRVVLKNARGHAFHEIGEPIFDDPTSVHFRPLSTMGSFERSAFESYNDKYIETWPEVGSRMMSRLVEGTDLVNGWVQVEQNRYRYAANWSSGVRVRTVIWEYLATETFWDL